MEKGKGKGKSDPFSMFGGKGGGGYINKGKGKGDGGYQGYGGKGGGKGGKGVYGFDGNWYESPDGGSNGYGGNGRYAWTLASMVEAPPGLKVQNRWTAIDEANDEDVQKEQRAKDYKEMEAAAGTTPNAQEYEERFPKEPMGNYSKPKLYGPRFKPVKKQVMVPLSLFVEDEDGKARSPELCPATIAENGWQWVKGVVDSGAANSVAHPEMCPNYPVQPSAGSKAGVEYTCASGGVLPNLGEQVLNVVTQSGRDAQVRYQSADVSRTLNSVSEICDGGGESGQYVLFSKWGGQVLNPETGTRMSFDREGGIYTMGMWVRPNGDQAASVFPRPGK